MSVWLSHCTALHVLMRLQNPMQRPILGTIVPTLLKDGLMFCIKNPAATDYAFEERWLFGKDWFLSSWQWYFAAARLTDWLIFTKTKRLRLILTGTNCSICADCSGALKLDGLSGVWSSVTHISILSPDFTGWSFRWTTQAIGRKCSLARGWAGLAWAWFLVGIETMLTESL